MGILHLLLAPVHVSVSVCQQLHTYSVCLQLSSVDDRLKRLSIVAHVVVLHALLQKRNKKCRENRSLCVLLRSHFKKLPYDGQGRSERLA